MRDAFNFDVVIDALADRLAGKLRTGGSRGEGGPAIRPRLLTVEQAATYLRRTKASVQHLLRQELPKRRPHSCLDGLDEPPVFRVDPVQSVHLVQRTKISAGTEEGIHASL